MGGQNMAEKYNDPLLKLQFDGNNEFKIELQSRVDEFFSQTGRSLRDSPVMYFKTVVILSLFALTYILLVFYASTWWQAVTLSVFLGLTIAGIGFNIQHDGGHNAYSKYQWINKMMAMTLDIIGGSSYYWKWKHVVFHHRYVNIYGYDPDADLGFLGRFQPHAKYRFYFKYQHIYIWVLYSLMVPKWHFVDDYYSFITRKVGAHTVPRPSGWEIPIFFLGKIAFLVLALGIPLLHHRVLPVLGCYFIAAMVLGLLMSFIFQLPHCVEESEYPMPNPATGRMDRPWSVHQAIVSLDFDRNNPYFTWLLGGLNFHKEHHLLPVVNHVNYPVISPLVQQTCKKFGVPYREHTSIHSAVASHYRWLKRMGQKEV